MRTAPARKARLCLCSNSPIKVRAVRAALEELGYTGVELITCQAPPGLPAQPVGREETEELATIRASAALQSVKGGPERAFGLGIESGIRQEKEEGEGEWEEYTEVVLVTDEGHQYFEGTPAVPLAREDVEAARGRRGGFKSNTVGEAVAARLGGDPKDPITTMTRGARTREGLIQEAARRALRNLAEDLQHLKVDLGYQEEPRHPVNLDFMSTELLLPVRVLGDGRRLAYFDCAHPALSQGALESLARGLCRLDSNISRVDAVITPEGKAVALAYEAARILDVPLVIPRKRTRPVDPACHEVTYGSTTSGINQLHLTAAQAATLKGAHVLFVDDVVTTGGSLRAAASLARMAGAESVTAVAVFYETGDLGRAGNGPVELDGGDTLHHYLALLPEPGIL